MAISRPDLRPVAHTVCQESGAKISGEIERESSLPAEAGGDTNERQAQPHGRQLSRSNVPLVSEGKDDKHEDTAWDKLREKLGCLGAGNYRSRISSKDAGGGIFAKSWNGANARTALECINRLDVVRVNNTSGRESSQNLGQGIHGKLTPRETAKDAHGEGHSWIEMATRLPSNIGSEGNSNAVQEVSTSGQNRGKAPKTNPQPSTIDVYVPFSPLLKTT